MKNPVIIIGAQQLGRNVLDIFHSNDVVVYCFLDDDVALQNKEVNDVAVMGTSESDDFLKLLGNKCEVFVAADDIAMRKTLVNMLKDEYKAVPVNAVHKFSFVSEHAWLGHGNVVGAGAVIQPNAKIGDNCIINSRAIVESDAHLDDFVQIGSGAIINSEVKIGEGAFIGSGAVIVSGVKIGKNARVGAGSVVIADVAANQTVFGNPAKKVE